MSETDAAESGFELYPQTSFVPKRTGRKPMEFSQRIADHIVEALTNGESLGAICDDDSMPSKPTIYKWLRENQSFADDYARARDLQQDTLIDEIVLIADTEIDPAKARIRIEARRWHAAHLAPKKYGQRVDVTQTIGLSDPLTEMLSRVAGEGMRLVQQTKTIDYQSEPDNG